MSKHPNLQNVIRIVLGHDISVFIAVGKPMAGFMAFIVLTNIIACKDKKKNIKQIKSKWSFVKKNSSSNANTITDFKAFAL